MTCPCIRSRQIAICTQSLVIGQIDQVNTSLDVYIKNTSTGRITRFETDSDGSGIVVINTTDFLFGDNMNYEASITLHDNAVLIEFTTGEVTGTCIWFSVNNLDDSVSALYASASETGGTFIVRYKAITTDYAWPGSVYTVVVLDTSAVVTATGASPVDYEKGRDYTFKDLSGVASGNHPKFVGPFEDGSAFKEILSDLGSITFQTNGIDKFFITGGV